MKIGSMVRFNDDYFFEGAVQLTWFEKKQEQARKAAEAFVFHGPKYHGASSAEADGIDSNYRLKDSATFVNDLLHSISIGQNGQDTNPYWLVVAGYGSGKSHLGLTCATLLSQPSASTSEKVLQNIAKADLQVAQQVRSKIETLAKPVLVLPLDGMSGFHLGNALSKAVFRQLDALGLDAEPIRNLSPRFKVASKFVELNFSVRQSRFEEYFPSLDSAAICRRLSEHDEEAYEVVDRIFREANGDPIPIEGQESSQELIDTLCNTYCAEDGPFSHVVILFDEFGRYLEYAADKPHLAGDSSLQQIFQGIQDNSSKVHFVGFIQYELKTYLKRFSSAGARQLQRYITRFDAAEKWYLSTNLETIFAHMILKDEVAIEDVWLDSNAARKSEETHLRLANTLPGFNRYPVWQDLERFSEVIAKGCWPLHPLAVWFLARQKDVVQSRSALTFIKDLISQISQDDIVTGEGLRQISVADLVLTNLLPELVAAERESGGTVAETLQTLLEKFAGHLTVPQQKVLAAIAAMEKMRVGKQELTTIDVLLSEATVFSNSELSQVIDELTELGAVEWNRDLGRYDLLTDGASRGQFQQWLRKLKQNFNAEEAKNLFMRRASQEKVLDDIHTDFGQISQVSTSDWIFSASVAHSGNLRETIKQAFREWSEAHLATDPKGKVIYVYFDENDDIVAIGKQIERLFLAELEAQQVQHAPIWLIGLNDSQARIMENLISLHVFGESASSSEQEIYRRFIPEEIQRCQQGLDQALKGALKERIYWVAGFDPITETRQKKVANKIFSNVYTKVVPFPFDGFATKNGTARADCAQLMRGLIARQVDGNWVQAQRKTLHNRVDTLLVKTWGCLLGSGKLVAPREPSTKAVFEEIVRRHQSSQNTSLSDTYHRLIKPPYGMNSASAGLLVSLLVSLDSPPRRLNYDGDLIASSDWAQIAFKGKANDFQLKELEKTTLLFLSETSESRWQVLIEKWEGSSSYVEKIAIADEAKKLFSVDKIPESLEGLYRYLLDDVDQIRSAISSKEKLIEEVEKGLQKAERTNDVGHALAIGKKAHRLNKELDAGYGLWPEELTQDIQHLVSIIKAIIAEGVASWIPRQICKSVTNLADFRSKAEAQAETLKLLNFEPEYEKLKAQITSSIHRVEHLQKYQLTIAECEDYPRQPISSVTESVKKLRENLRRGNELIDTLETAEGVLTREEITAHIEAIKIRQKKLKLVDEEKCNELSALFEPPKTEQELNKMILTASSLQQAFVGTRDEEDIKEIIDLLMLISDDLKAWPSSEMAADQYTTTLNKQAEKQAETLRAYLEQEELELPWTEDVHKVIAKERAASQKKRSESWLIAKDSLVQELDSFTILECSDVIRELQRAPSYLADEERAAVKNLIEACKAKLNFLKEEESRIIIADWLAKFPSQHIIGELSRQQAEQWLAVMEKPPRQLNPSEYREVEVLRGALSEQLDQLTLDDIITRILKLPNEKLRELIERIQP
jgi:hypothetical protein